MARFLPALCTALFAFSATQTLAESTPAPTPQTPEATCAGTLSFDTSRLSFEDAVATLSLAASLKCAPTDILSAFDGGTPKDVEDVALECLRSYQKEEEFAGATEANNKFYLSYIHAVQKAMQCPSLADMLEGTPDSSNA